MKTFDLIPDGNQLETLFIMESPYIEELATGIPCSGKTGKRMTSEIFPKHDEAFGNLLATEQDFTLKYGIMNSFPFALGLAYQLPPEQQLFTQIKNIKYTNRPTFYNDHLQLLHSFKNLEEQTHFKARLIEYIKNAPNIKNLVFCGYIAQAMYLHTFNKSPLQYNKPNLLQTASKKEIYGLFVNHPSEKNDVWDFKIGSIL